VAKTSLTQIINVLFLETFQNSLIVPNKNPILLKETTLSRCHKDCCNAQKEVRYVGIRAAGLRWS
jgi:hypothetical protein